jgi:hypothetical protein
LSYVYSVVKIERESSPSGDEAEQNILPVKEEKRSRKSPSRDYRKKSRSRSRERRRRRSGSRDR